jgi:hypothetical protein
MKLLYFYSGILSMSNVLDVTTCQDPGMTRDAEACDTEEYL